MKRKDSKIKKVNCNNSFSEIIYLKTQSGHKCSTYQNGAEKNHHNICLPAPELARSQSKTVTTFGLPAPYF